MRLSPELHCSGSGSVAFYTWYLVFEAGSVWTPTQHKVIGDPFPVDWNSKTRIAGQLKGEGGLCSDHIVHVPKVRRPPSEKAPWGSKRVVMSRDALSRCLFGEIHLGWEIHAHTWEDPEIYQIQTVSQANQNDWSKETWNKYPIKVIQTAMRVQLWLSLWVRLWRTVLFPP